MQTACSGSRPRSSPPGLFLAPVIGGREPKYQRLGVNVLFGALLSSSSARSPAKWLSIQQKLGLDAGFWFGHQGYEYVDLGRVWQIALFAGLIWLVLMLRALWPALRKKGEERSAGRSSRAPPRDRPLLRRRPALRRAHAPVGRRVLALVGRAPVGRGLLRGLRDGGVLAFLFSGSASSSRQRRAAPSSPRPRSSCSAASPARSTTSTSAARRLDHRDRRDVQRARGRAARPDRLRGLQTLRMAGRAPGWRATAGRSASSSASPSGTSSAPGSSASSSTRRSRSTTCRASTRRPCTAHRAVRRLRPALARPHALALRRLAPGALRGARARLRYSFWAMNIGLA
jgi:hypothetical protein